MNAISLPETVIQALGSQASQDFVDWLTEHLPAFQAATQVQISAFIARQKVNVLMLEQVSNLLLADEPTLERTSAGQWQWRVPVDLTLPSFGRVGRVGEIVVDARYGRVYYDEALLSHIKAKADQLAEQTLA